MLFVVRWVCVRRWIGLGSKCVLLCFVSFRFVLVLILILILVFGT